MSIFKFMAQKTVKFKLIITKSQEKVFWHPFSKINSLVVITN